MAINHFLYKLLVLQIFYISRTCSMSAQSRRKTANDPAWRLPTTTDTGAAGCDFDYNGTDCGYNVAPTSSEMAHLFFAELGNLSQYTSSAGDSGAYTGGANPSAPWTTSAPSPISSPASIGPVRRKRRVLPPRGPSSPNPATRATRIKLVVSMRWLFAPAM